MSNRNDLNTLATIVDCKLRYMDSFPVEWTFVGRANTIELIAEELVIWDKFWELADKGVTTLEEAFSCPETSCQISSEKYKIYMEQATKIRDALLRWGSSTNNIQGPLDRKTVVLQTLLDLTANT